MKEDLLSITELAKLRGVTTETLRHYDRIGLFKPDYVDPETRYRYYSITQYEKLGTIKELRQLGMSLEEIGDYFNNRNLRKSIEILSRHHALMEREIKEKKVLEKNLKEKIEFLNFVLSEGEKRERIHEKVYEDGHMITYGKTCRQVKSLAYTLTRLEACIDEIAPILASNRIGCYTDYDKVMSGKDFEYCPMIFCKNGRLRRNAEDKEGEILKLQRAPGGLFVCRVYNGKIGCYQPEFKEVEQYIREKNYTVCGPVYQVYQIDITLTSDFAETQMEIRVPVKKM